MTAKRMTVAMIGSKGIPSKSGGVERHVEELSKRLVSDGLEVIVYTRGWYVRRKQKTFYGVRLIQLPSIHTKHWDAITHSLIAAVHAIVIVRADIIHIHGIGPALITPLVRLIPGVRVVVTYHSPDYYHQKWGRLARLLLRAGEWMACRYAHELIVVSEELNRHVWSVYRRQAAVIPNGAVVPESRPVATTRELLRRMKIGNAGYILYVGRLIPHKGVHTLITAYGSLKKNIPLVIVGDGHHTDHYVQTIKILARANKDILFVGERYGRELDALWRGAAVVVQPSESEGLSLSLLEAMSYRKPVVVSDIAENRDVVPNPDFWFHTNDANDLVRVLRFVLARDDAAQRQARVNQSIVRDRYNWDRIAQRTVLVYQQLARPAAPVAAELART
ncbi:glycosyltransferase family 4 protein [Candidatus Uhrbacteria bacterium]|nr:glycosyltransferase family 4 protein [Candidatus Uhrbacteria bacterium]